MSAQTPGTGLQTHWKAPNRWLRSISKAGGGSGNSLTLWYSLQNKPRTQTDRVPSPLYPQGSGTIRCLPEGSAPILGCSICLAKGNSLFCLLKQIYHTAKNVRLPSPRRGKTKGESHGTVSGQWHFPQKGALLVQSLNQHFSLFYLLFTEKIFLTCNKEFCSSVLT